MPIIDSVDPDSDFGGHRVSKAREQVGLRRWLAGCLDRDTYGERPPQVNVQVNASLAAFSDLKPRAPEVDMDADAPPRVEAPDGKPVT
jgi:hypothetical protein